MNGETAREKQFYNVEKFFAFSIIFYPLFISLFDIAFDIISYEVLLLCYLVFYGIFKVLKFFDLEIKIKSLFSSPFKIILWCCLGWIILTSVINNANPMDVLTYMTFLLMIANFSCIKSEDRKSFMKYFVYVLTICVIMSIFDPNNEFMPGFIDTKFMYAGQFLNPNHFGYVVVLAIIMATYLFEEETNIYVKLSFLACFIFMSFYMFFNRGLGPTLAIIFALLFSFIYRFVKEKKFPLFNFIFLISFLSIGFVVEFVPAFIKCRGEQYGFYQECLAVFDNIFHTHLLNKTGVDHIVGSDGWGRKEKYIQSFENLKTHFLFGNGAGYSNQFRPHNEFLYLALDFGIIAGVIYLFFVFFVIIRNLKDKNMDIIRQALTFSVMGYFVSGLVGNVTNHSFIYFIMAITLCYRKEEKEYLIKFKSFYKIKKTLT